MTKTLQTLQSEIAQVAPGRLHDELSYMIDAARVNADDTVYAEKAAPASDWDRIAMDTLEQTCAFSKDAEAVAWFVARGVRF